MSYRNVAILLAVALFGSCVGCASSAVMSASSYDPAVGGDGWRVMGAELVDNRDALAGLALVQADVAECLGIEPGSPPARFYTVLEIRHRSGPDSWARARGMTILEDRAVYVVRPRTQLQAYRAAVTLRHELIHLLKQLPHPEADPFIAECSRLDWRTAR